MGQNETESCTLPGVTSKPKIKLFLSQAVFEAYAKTFLCSPLWNNPLSGSVVLTLMFFLYFQLQLLI